MTEMEKKAAKNLERLHSTLGNNALSGNQVSSEAGKTALAALLSESLDGDFRHDVAKSAIAKTLGLKR